MFFLAQWYSGATMYDPIGFFTLQIAETGKRKHEKRLAALWETIKKAAWCVDEGTDDSDQRWLSMGWEWLWYYAPDEQQVPELYVTDTVSNHQKLRTALCSKEPRAKIYVCLRSKAEMRHVKLMVCREEAESWDVISHFPFPRKPAIGLGADVHYMFWLEPQGHWKESGLFAYSAKDCSAPIMRFFISGLRDARDELVYPQGKDFAVPDTKTLRTIVRGLFHEARPVGGYFLFFCWAVPCVQQTI